MRFRDLRLLAATPGYRVLAAREVDGPRVVVVRPERDAGREEAIAGLRRLARSHAEVGHPRVPGVASAVLEGDDAYVALRFAAVATGLEVASRMTARGVRLPYASADGFVLSLREALQAGHRTPGGPYCLGRVSLANVLFDEEGRHVLFGFGHNVAVEDEHGRPDPRVPFFQAPELLVSGTPTPMTDYVALLALARSIVVHVELPAAVHRVLSGQPASTTDRVLAKLLRFTEQRVLGELPARRPALAQALAVAQQIRRALGVQADRDGIAPIAARLLAEGRAAEMASIVSQGTLAPPPVPLDVRVGLKSPPTYSCRSEVP